MNALFLSLYEKRKSPKKNVCEWSTIIKMSMNVLFLMMSSFVINHLKSTAIETDHILSTDNFTQSRNPQSLVQRLAHLYNIPVSELFRSS